MPRKPRIKSKNNIYHVVIKGIDQQLIFEERNDYIKYLEILEFYKYECHFKLFAYCLMSNHTHILMQVTDIPLETIFRKINTNYAVWFNMKYQRTGHLQNGRYYSEPVEDIHHLFSAVKYIHCNPMKAGLETVPGESYPWSSIYEYKSCISKLVDLDLINYFFSKSDLLDTSTFEKTNFLDIDNIKKRIPDDVAKEIIAKECNCKNVSDFLKFTILERNKYISKLHSLGLSVRQLNRLTGISKGIIQSIIKCSQGHSF